MPSTPRAVEIGARSGSTFLSARPGATAYSCHPRMPTTASPIWNSGSRDSTTRPTAPPVMTSPIAIGASLASVSLIRARR